MRKTSTFTIFQFIVFFVLIISGLNGQSKDLLELKIYTLENEAQEKAVDDYLEKALMPALKRQDIGPIGVFKQRTENTDTINKIYVLTPLKTFDQFIGINALLDKDLNYQNAGNSYLNTIYKNPSFKRIETILLTSFSEMPHLKASKLTSPRKDRVYELRSYESASEAIFANKVDMFNAGGEVDLFEKLGFNAVFYGEVISGPTMPNLMYMTTHENLVERKKNWKSFVDAPEWKKMSGMPKYQNNVSHIDIYFLYPTAYSDY